MDEVAGTSTLMREYIWMDGMPVAVVQGGVVYYIRVDHIGRPVFATDDTGAKVWEALYHPFGSVETITSSSINLRFPGQWFQLESGLHQNWMRDYDPTTGRYMQADPLGLVDGASVYNYAQQNPMRYTDARGESVQIVCRPLDFGTAGQLASMITDKAQHCATFVVKDENECFCESEIDADGIIAQFSLVSPNTTFDGNGGVPYSGGYDLDRETYNRQNAFSPYGSGKRWIIPVPAGQSSCEFDRNVKREGENYSQGRYRNFSLRHPNVNSNTAAHSIVRSAGGQSPDTGSLHSLK